MSRSYRKNYFVKDHNKGQKQLANRRLRSTYKLLPLKGGNYKKCYPQWDICDYLWYWSKEYAIQEWYEEEAKHYKFYAWRHKEYKTLENWLNYWKKCVRRK